MLKQPEGWHVRAQAAQDRPGAWRGGGGGGWKPARHRALGWLPACHSGQPQMAGGGSCKGWAFYLSKWVWFGGHTNKAMPKSEVGHFPLRCRQKCFGSIQGVSALVPLTCKAKGFSALEDALCLQNACSVPGLDSLDASISPLDPQLVITRQ